MKQIQKIIFLADCSKSMNGKPIKNVNSAILTFQESVKSIKTNTKLETNIIGFSSKAFFIKNLTKSNPLKIGGYTNLAMAYEILNQELKKCQNERSPILVLMTDGCPNVNDWEKSFYLLNKNSVFKKSLKFAVGYNIDNKYAWSVLKKFTGEPRNVFKTFSVEKLKNILITKTKKILDYQIRHKSTSKKVLIQILADDVEFIKKIKKLK